MRSVRDIGGIVAAGGVTHDPFASEEFLSVRVRGDAFLNVISTFIAPPVGAVDQ
jgi:hypothetical protein